MKARRPSWSGPALIIGSALFAASCATAPVAWEKPDGNQDQWVQDKGACQSKARREAEKRFRLSGATASSTGFETDTLSRNMAQYDARRDQRRLFEDCLKARGYTRKKAPAADAQ